MPLIPPENGRIADQHPITRATARASAVSIKNGVDQEQY